MPEVRHEAARDGGAATTYACPMHPEVVERQAGPCPKCGMKLRAGAALVSELGDHHEHDADEHDGTATTSTTHGEHDDHHGHEQATTATSHAHGAPAASSGRTTWSRSTG